MKIKEIIKEIEEFAPKNLAADFDNVGFLLGDKENETNCVLTTLDVTMEVAKEAVQKQAGLIITHHPLIFSAQKTITSDTVTGEIILYLMKNNIAVYAAHTNMDSAKGGINDVIAQKLKLNNVTTLQPHPEGMGIGRVGYLNTTMKELCETIMQEFPVTALHFTGKKDDKVQKVALCSGSGSDDELLFYALKEKADVYITGEIKYHHALEASAKGLNLIELRHFESEYIVADIFADIISKNCKNVKVCVSEHKNVFNVISK